MKPDISFLLDEEYDTLIAEWESYAGVSTWELQEKYDTTEIHSTELYAAENHILSVTEYYYLEDCMDALKKYILTQDDFKEVCICDNFEWAVDMFIENLIEDMADQCTYFIPHRDLGISWLNVNCHGEQLYLNLDEIWAYWVGLNEENYFDA